MSNLSPRQALFVEEYLVDLNASQAAIRAGYSPVGASSKGSQLLATIKVRLEVDKRMAARSERTNISQDFVLSTIVSTVNRCSQAEPVLDKEGTALGEYKFDASNVLKGCELLGRHLAMWTDKQKIDMTAVVTGFTRRIVDTARGGDGSVG